MEKEIISWQDRERVVAELYKEHRQHIRKVVYQNPKTIVIRCTRKSAREVADYLRAKYIADIAVVSNSWSWGQVELCLTGNYITSVQVKNESC